MPDSAGVVERYLAAVAAQDWDAFQECLTEDVVRIGPFGDRYQGKDVYTAFLRRLMPSLVGYRMEVHRIFPAGDGTTVVAELSESIEIDGKAVVTPECLVFGLGGDGRIRTVAIYVQTLPAAPA